MSFARCTSYNDSGVPWLGEVPAGWAIKRIKHLVTSFEQGWSPQCEGFPVESADEWGVLKVGCVNGGVFRPRENKALPPEVEPIPSLGIVAGDLLISRANTRELVGSAAVVSGNHRNLLLCDKLYRARFRQAVCKPEFVAFYLGVGAVRGQIELAATGASSSMVNIGQSTILELEIAVPELQEQETLVAFLNRETAKIDALVAEQQKLIALLKEKRQAVISHAVTKGLDPTAPMKDSGVEWLGEVPAHWALRPLKYLVRFQSGGTPSKGNPDFWDGDIPWASAKDMKVDVLGDTEDHITATAVASGAASLVPESALIVVVRGMILAHTFPVAQLACSLSINQDLKALLPSDAIRSGFLAWTLRGLSREILDRVSEAGHGTCALRTEDWVSMTLPVPPIEEQAEIERRIEVSLHQLDALVREAQTAILLLQERRTALISAVVTGKIEVREAVAVAEEVA
ncbi:restriction endonuclease subunit S [Variovorax paradoxus]|uniref:restriction endonuclease subunit S n=1 Tax=Variovorax paradoxus TaxID=34073 RepID=UPI000368FA69|nr:restriction endonuclease subunit S [Variovorax paradoxus]